jgi:hypothetical protein
MPQQISFTFDALRTSTSAFLEDELEEAKTSKWHLPLLLLRWIFYLPIASIVRHIHAIVNTSDVSPGSTHVPTFFATNVGSSNSDDLFIYFALPFISIFFGGLHCVGWNFVFPTSTEQILWRVSSLCITAIPLVTGLTWFLSQEGYLDMFKLKVLLYPALTLLVVYVLARLVLLAQALALLGREPPTAYHAVDWSKCLSLFS